MRRSHDWIVKRFFNVIASFREPVGKLLMVHVRRAHVK
jgi:hypothetical protein